MPRSSPRVHIAVLVLGRIIRYLARWLLLIAPMAAATGSASALFLWLLEKATDARIDHSWLLLLLGSFVLLCLLMF